MADMFTGEYRYSMDVKGRISIPAKFREALGSEFKICKGFDKCLCIYPLEQWENFAKKISELPEARQRHVKRYFFSGTNDCVLDAQGRIAVPPVYRQFAALEKDIVIVGNENRIEVWSPDEWNREAENMTSEDILNDLMECGF